MGVGVVARGAVLAHCGEGAKRAGRLVEPRPLDGTCSAHEATEHVLQAEAECEHGLFAHFRASPECRSDRVWDDRGRDDRG